MMKKTVAFFMLAVIIGTIACASAPPPEKPLDTEGVRSRAKEAGERAK